MIDYIAQTNIQLFNQLLEQGYSEQDSTLLYDDYELAKDLFKGDLRGAGKSFISHLIGTSSVLLEIRASFDLIRAALFHSAYIDGQFGTGIGKGISEGKRQFIQHHFGEKIEKYIYEYTIFPWRESGVILQHLKDFSELTVRQKDILLMRLANEADEIYDWGILYCHNVEERLVFIEAYGESIILLSEALGQQELANYFRRMFARIKIPQIPQSLRFKLMPRYEVSSYRENVKHSPTLTNGLGLNKQASNQHIESNGNNKSAHISTLKTDPAIAKSTVAEQYITKPEQRHQLETKFDTNNHLVDSRSFKINQAIATRFEQQVVLYPDQVALKTPTQELTYQQLNEQSNQLAHQLIKKAPAEQQLVPILFEHSSAMAVAILGVLKAGKAWVPLDTSYPITRLELIFQELDAAVLVTNQRNYDLAIQLTETEESVITLENIASDVSVTNPELEISPEAIACVLYTSGSTGQPKGVIHSQKNILHLVRRGTRALQITAGDRLSVIPSYSHMAGTNDMFRGLLNGATVLPYDIKTLGISPLAKWLETEKISIYHSVPTLFRHFIHTVSERQKFPSMRVVHLGGETLSRQDFKLFQQHFPSHCRLLNNLGCTELSSYRQYFADSDTTLPTELVPVGYAPEDVEVLLWDAHDQPVKPGETGEVILRSAYLSPGYWRKPEQTAATFFTAPDDPSKRCYRTGDLAYQLEDGCLIHLGRKDFQVQIRGFRVEIGEIEATLLGHPKIKEVAVLGDRNQDAEIQLTAYVVSKPDADFEEKELVEHVRSKLPEYMIPTAWERRSQLPLTPNGKVNRLALSPSKTSTPLPQATSKSVASPTTNLEQTIVAAWQTVLGKTSFDHDTNFFLAGGDSLKVMRVIAQINENLNIALPLRSFFEEPTISALVKQIDRILWFTQDQSNSQTATETIWEEIEI